MTPDRQHPTYTTGSRVYTRALCIDFDCCNAGSDEGAFAWLTLNYLLGFLGKEGADTMAAIDLGGGSVQEAFALTDAQAKAAPDPLYVTQLKGGGVTYSVYVHRYHFWARNPAFSTPIRPLLLCIITPSH